MSFNLAIVGIEREIRSVIGGAESPADALAIIERLRDTLHELSPLRMHPVDRVRWVPVERVQANDYNPNSVAKAEMRLLYTSIAHDGYTQPVVTIKDDSIDKHIIVDGFHRHLTCKSNEDIRISTMGHIPLVRIAKGINDRMASTVRHNRARGKHSVKGMSGLVFSMLKGGWKDEDICNELGMEGEELVRLKHITGFSKLFEKAEYSREFLTQHQIGFKGSQ